MEKNSKSSSGKPSEGANLSTIKIGPLYRGVAPYSVSEPFWPFHGRIFANFGKYLQAGAEYELMNGDREYIHAMENLYEKSLILHDTSMWHPVLRFYFIDALAHIDYSIGIMAFNFHSPKNIMAGEYMRWRIDEEKKGDRAKFPDFINWLDENHPEKFERLPYLWQRIYRKSDIASYRSFRIVLDPDNREPIRAAVLRQMTNDFFDNEFLKSLYDDASLSKLFNEFIQNK